MYNKKFIAQNLELIFCDTSLFAFTLNYILCTNNYTLFNLFLFIF